MKCAEAGSQTPLRNRSRGAAFLCYHSIHPDGPPFLSLSPELFERQLDGLRRSGHRTAGVGALEAIRRGDRPDGRQILLTFDDGFRDNYTHAFPLLREAGATALVFLLPPAVDAGGPLVWPEVAERAARHPDVFRSLTWSMVEEMAEGGIEFGSHTLEHHRLTGLDDDALAQDLLDSRRRIAARLGRCDALAYPFGGWDGRVEAAAARAGYRWAFTMPLAAQRDAGPLSIPRIAVDQRDDERRFALKSSPVGRRLLLSPAKERARRARGLARRLAP